MSKDETKGTADRDDKDEDEDDDDDEESESDEGGDESEEEGKASTKGEDESDEDESDEDESDEDESDEDESDEDESDEDESDEDESDEDESDEDESDEDESDEDESDEDDEKEEAPAASARPPQDDGRAARARRRRELEHGSVPTAAPAADDEDPTWWLPHAVLGGLVLVGVLGFFGVFNKALGFIPRPASSAGGEATAAPTSKPASAPMPPNPHGSAAQPPKEMFGAKHVLVMYKGGRRAPANVERSKEEAKKRAEEVVKKAKSGTKFEDLVKEYSDEPNAAQRGGDLGNFPKGAMVPEFQAGLEKTKVGEISETVESPFGFHVILRTK